MSAGPRSGSAAKTGPRGLDADQFGQESLPITEGIVSFCGKLQAETPLYIGIDPTEGARQHCCYRNVRMHAAVNGGLPLYGWMISEVPGLYRSAEFHCVWMQLYGGLSDFTPRADGESAILFAPDRLEKLIDTFLREAGRLEDMLAPTKEGTVCGNLNRLDESLLRMRELERMELKLRC
jgi:hypothetical protein